MGSGGAIWMWPALLASVALGAFGQILMKEAMKHAGPIPIEGEIPELIHYFLQALLSLPIIGAIFCYGFSFLLWISVLSVADLSLARPVVSLGYAVTLLYGFWAGEDVTWERIAGTLLIMGGLFFVARSS